MNKTEIISIRVTPQLKKAAENLFDNCGLSLSQACQVFLKQAIRVGGLPFDVKAEANAAAEPEAETAPAPAKVKKEKKAAKPKAKKAPKAPKVKQEKPKPEQGVSLF
jgi:DNA-damage-inducible protein J